MAPLRPDYIAPFPFRPSSAPSRGASRGSSPARLRLGPRSPEPSRPCSAPGRLSPWRRGARAASPKRSAWSADGQRHDRRMPKLNRKQRAVGAKEKLDRLSAPALRGLRLNLWNVRAWMQPEISKVAVEEDLKSEASKATVLESESGLLLPEDPEEEPADVGNPLRVRVEWERQVSPVIVSPHSAEAAKAQKWKRWESAYQRLQLQGEVDKELCMQGIELAGFTIRRQEWLDEVVLDITTYNSLDKEEFMRMLQKYEEKQYDEFIAVFQHFDADGNDRLEGHELAALLEHCGITALDQVLKEIMVEVAPADTAHLTIEEFRKVIEIIHVNEGFSSREITKLKEVFRRFDLDRGGFLDTRELHKALTWLGFGLTRQEVEDISSSCDVGGKGQLEEHEFLGFMRRVKEREISLVKRALIKSRRANKGGAVHMQKQLDRVLRALGYIPNAQAIRDAGEDSGIIRFNPAEVVELQGHGNQPWKSMVSGQSRRQSFQSSPSRRTSVVSMATITSSRRLSMMSSRRNSGISLGGQNSNPDLDDTLRKSITLSNFFSFLEVYRQREGLDRIQIMELEAVLKKYDSTGYGEMDIKDVGKVLRWMGYTASFDVQVMLTREVDVDESGTLDAVELRKLVRRFQEKELTAWTLAFQKALMPGERYLEVDSCVLTLRSLGIKASVEQVEDMSRGIAALHSKQRRFSNVTHAPSLSELAKLKPESVLLKAKAENSSSSSFADCSESLSSEEFSEAEDDVVGKIDLAVFHLICSKLVAKAKQAIRENAGYTTGEVQLMREKFQKYDSDGNGKIDNHEMAKLIQDLCPDLGTNLAKRAEIHRILSEVDPDKSGSVDFPDFLRLMRQIDEMQDRVRMAKEAFAIEQSKFSTREVEEFRKLFLGEETKKATFRNVLRLDEFLKLLQPVVGASRNNEEELTRLFLGIDEHMDAEFAEKVVEPMSPKGQRYTRSRPNDQDPSSPKLQQSPWDDPVSPKSVKRSPWDDPVSPKRQQSPWGDDPVRLKRQQSPWGDEPLSPKSFRTFHPSSFDEPLSPKSFRKIGPSPRTCVDFPEFLILMCLLLEKNLCHVKEKTTKMHQERRGAIRGSVLHRSSRLH